MASPSVNPRQEGQGEWARLIPGEIAALQRGAKKPPHSVGAIAFEKPPGAREQPARLPGQIQTLLLPSPLQSRIAWEWLRSTSADFALVGLNWLLVGALLVPLHLLFPRVRSFGYDAGRPVSLLGLALLHAALITLVGHTEGLHAAGSNEHAQGWIVGKSVLLATIVLCLAYALQGAPWTASGLVCGAGVLHFGALWTCRRRYRLCSSDRTDGRNVLIVGAGGVGRKIAAYLEQHPGNGRRVCGFLDDERPLGDGVIGRVTDLARMARKEFVDEVILAAPKNESLAQQVLREARRLRLDLEIVPELFGCKPAGREIERVGALPVICLHAERLPAAGLVLKRLADIFVAGLALVVLSPLLAVIALLIKLESRGSIFYCAPRAGRRARQFRCHKFRSMVSNADELKDALRKNNERIGPNFKIVRDPRITRLGQYLRRYSLDELPQLWNVLKGEMSLVGPRPHPLDDVAAYDIEHLARLDVTPGITGLWQITARRDSSFERVMELDREYIRTWSFGLDLQILLKTVRAVALGSGD